MYDYDRRVIAGVPATVKGFLLILQGLLIQWDQQQEAAARKKNRQHNIYGLGHLLKALEDIEGDMGASKDSSDPADLEKLKAAINRRLHAAPYVTKVFKAIDEFVRTGKAPKYPVQRKV
jgi:hypothetical protein